MPKVVGAAPPPPPPQAALAPPFALRFGLLLLTTSVAFSSFFSYDLPGITARLPHIASLGADVVWLSPFFTSPNRDMGYDVSDYCNVNPLFGTLADFDALLAKAHDLGLKVYNAQGQWPALIGSVSGWATLERVSVRDQGISAFFWKLRSPADHRDKPVCHKVGRSPDR
jgi:hypothetical protein